MFDLEKHEAISSVPVKERNKKGRVIEEIEPGYMLSDKIIRYPKVIIGK
jgi:molecular chaperone GrpE